MNENPAKSWDEARQAALIAQILSGELSLRAACERHDLSAEAIRDWVPIFRRRTLKALDESLLQVVRAQGANDEQPASAAYTGALSDLPLPDLLQTFQMGRKDAVITVTRAGERSYIWCWRGEIIDAESGRLRGEAAVYRILDLDDGQVFADFRYEARSRTIELSGQMLLIEAARRTDERPRLLERLNGPRAIYQPAPGALAASTTLIERDVLDLCDGVRSVRDVLDSGDIGDFETLGAMASLVERGYLLREGTSPMPPRSANAPIVTNETPYAIAFPLTAPRSPEPSVASKRSIPLMLGLGVVLGTLLWAGIGVLTHRAPWLASEGSPGPTFILDATTRPLDAQLWLDGAPAGAGHVRRELSRDGTVHRLDVVSRGHVPTTVLFVDAAPISSIVLEKLPER